MNVTPRLLVIAAALLALPAAASAEPGDAYQQLYEMLDLAGWPAERLEALAAQTAESETPPVELVELALRLKRAKHLLATPIAGRVIGVKRIELLPEEVEKLGAKEFFECKLSIDDEPDESIRLITLQTPSAWREIDELKEPISGLGMWLGPEGARAALMAPKIAWHPDTPRGEVVRFGEFVLGAQGFDASRFDDVVDGAPLLGRERDLFYALLAETRGIGAHQLARTARGHLKKYAEPWIDRTKQNPRDGLAAAVLKQAKAGAYSVAPLFNDAVRQRGELLVFDGLVRRCLRVASPEAAEEFGVDHYYELELFTADSQNLPLVFCMLELPDGFPVGDDLRQEARLAGFFVKRWAYRTRKPTSNGASHDKPQLAPLLVGRAPIALAPPSVGPRIEVIAAAAFVAAIAGVWVVVWRLGRGDEAFERDLRERWSAATPEPDFAGLAERDDGPRE